MTLRSSALFVQRVCKKMPVRRWTPFESLLSRFNNSAFPETDPPQEQFDFVLFVPRTNSDGPAASLKVLFLVSLQLVNIKSLLNIIPHAQANTLLRLSNSLDLMKRFEAGAFFLAWLLVERPPALATDPSNVQPAKRACNKTVSRTCKKNFLTTTPMRESRPWMAK